LLARCAGVAGRAPAKTGPDTSIRAILLASLAAEAINSLPGRWRRSGDLARGRRFWAEASGPICCLIEGRHGLFDGAADGKGSTGDLARL